MCPRMVVKGFDTARTIRSVCVFGQRETAMDTRDDKIEGGQGRAVLEDIGLDALQDSEAAAVRGVQYLDALVLLPNSLDREPARVARRP